MSVTHSVKSCRPVAPVEIHYGSETDYSEDCDSEEEEEEEDDISVCSGSTISAGGQSCTVSDMFTSGFDEAYSDGEPNNLLCVTLNMLANQLSLSNRLLTSA